MIHPRPIIVLGVDRSGTSLASEILSKWGAYAGDLSQLGEATHHNPQGYWEYEPMQNLMDDLMTHTGLSNCHPDMDRRVAELAGDPLYRGRAQQLIDEMEAAAQGGPWLWKEPYLSVTLSFWEQLWYKPVYVITVRNPNDSALSYQKMFVPPELRDHGVRIIAMFLLRWQHFMLSILKHSEANPSTIFVPYEKLLQNPEEQCRRLAGFLDARCGMDEGHDQRVARMIEAVNPGLWRNKSPLSFFDVPEATPEQKALFEFLHRKVDDPTAPYDPRLYQISAGAREYLHAFERMFDSFLGQQTAPSP